MDPVTMIFYAIVCGSLGFAGPALGRPPIRLAIGALVGIVAAGALPWLRGMTGL